MECPRVWVDGLSITGNESDYYIDYLPREKQQQHPAKKSALQEHNSTPLLAAANERIAISGGNNSKRKIKLS